LQRCRSASGGSYRNTGQLACFLHCNDFAALVLAAFAADTMGQLALMAVGALGGADRCQEVVAASLGGTLLGVAAFRIRHCGSLSNGPARSCISRRQIKADSTKIIVLAGLER